MSGKKTLSASYRDWGHCNVECEETKGLVFKMTVLVAQISLHVLDKETSEYDMLLFEKIMTIFEYASYLKSGNTSSKECGILFIYLGALFDYVTVMLKSFKKI